MSDHSTHPRRVRPLVIVGPTAAGKSALAVGLADRFRDRGTAVELINADSMQVYRGMDIGTAKASETERIRIPHHLLDVVEPSEEFSVAEFVRLANDALDDIHARGSLPIIVGGTGLYVQALVDGMRIPGQFPEERASLEANPDTSALYRELMDTDPVAAERIDPNNRRRIVRALEVSRGSGRPFSSYGDGFDSYPETDFVMVGIEMDRGFVLTNERLATNVPGVYAVGDIVPGLQLAHRGYQQGIFLAEELAGLGPVVVEDANIPKVTYCDPEVASVGLTEAKAAEKYGAENITSYEYNLAGNAKSSILGTAGSVKAVRLNDGPVLGVHMIGARVGELVGEAQLIVNWEAYPEDVAPFVHGHPTQNETIGETMLKLAGKPLHAI